MDYHQIDLKGKKALFFDCDGTLADTMPAHNKAYELAFLLNGVPWSKTEHEKWAGFGGSVLMDKTVAAIGYEDKIESIIRDKQKLLPFCLEKFMRPNHDIIRWIKFLRETKKIRIFIVSNGRRNSIINILNALDIAYKIDGLITPELVAYPKPSPDLYNFALALATHDVKELVRPEDVIVFEDNDIGMNAAKNAGIKNIIEVKTNEF
ncbi:MAG TPA: HAD family phosphatase [Pseudoneobacillus sp.]|nr:HAD family phosphatase [Pseudoneobacillus sp.]